MGCCWARAAKVRKEAVRKQKAAAGKLSVAHIKPVSTVVKAAKPKPAAVPEYAPLPRYKRKCVECREEVRADAPRIELWCNSKGHKRARCELTFHRQCFADAVVQRGDPQWKQRCWTPGCSGVPVQKHNWSFDKRSGVHPEAFFGCPCEASVKQWGAGSRGEGTASSSSSGAKAASEAGKKKKGADLDDDLLEDWSSLDSLENLLFSDFSD